MSMKLVRKLLSKCCFPFKSCKIVSEISHGKPFIPRSANLLLSFVIYSINIVYMNEEQEEVFCGSMNLAF